MAKYPLATPTWGEEEIGAIERVVRRGFFTMGDEVLGFEREYAEFVESKHAVMVNSGSSANLLAVASLFFVRDRPLQRGDEVIVPAVSWSTTYTPLAQYGLRLKFVDVDRNTLNYDLASLREAVTSKTRLVVVVNLLGNPNEFSELFKIVDKEAVWVIEDACESMGARYGGKSAGTFGHAGTFSTFFSHHISTMEGGLVVTDDEELFHILLCLRSHGWTRHLPQRNRVTGEKDADSFRESFKFVLPGYNVRPLELSGAIGREQLRKLPGFVRQRRENARLFKALLGNRQDLRIQQEVGESSWFGFSLIVGGANRLDRGGLVRSLASRGVEVRPIVAGNILSHGVMKYIDHEVVGKLENAEEIDAHGFFVGNHHYQMKEELEYLSRAIGEYRG